MSDLICHVAKVKAARSALSMADVIHFFKVFNIPFEANALIKPKKYLFNTLRNIFRVSTFQQLFPNMAIFSTVSISRNHVQLARSLFRIERFDKIKKIYISHAIKKTICETFKNHALKITVTHTVRLRAMRNTKKKT